MHGLGRAQQRVRVQQEHAFVDLAVDNDRAFVLEVRRVLPDVLEHAQVDGHPIQNHMSLASVHPAQADVVPIFFFDRKDALKRQAFP